MYLSKQISLTNRDLQIILDLYLFQMMTREQIQIKHFPNSNHYSYKRLRVLRDAGYIKSDVFHVQKGVEVAAHYRVTEKGLRLLLKQGLIPEIDVRARKLQLTKQHYPTVIGANDVFIHLGEYICYGSRLTKKRHDLDRGDLVAGSIESRFKQHSIYILQNNLRRETMFRLLSEIDKNSSSTFDSQIIYFKGADARAFFFSEYRKNRPPSLLHLLPHTELGIEVTRRLILNEDLNNLLNLVLSISFQELAKTEHGFRFTIRNNGDESYLEEYLTCNPVVLENLVNSRYYNMTSYKSAGKRVTLLCWEEDEGFIRELTKAITYVDIVPVNSKALSKI